MKILKSTGVIHYLALAYAVLYLVFMIDFDFGKPLHPLNAESIGVNLLFGVFLIGLVFSWFNGIISGILFLVWNMGMWIVELFFVQKDGGFGMVSGVPLLVLSVFFILKEYKAGKDPAPGKKQQWQLVLRILLMTYTLLYLIFVLAGFKEGHKPDLLSWPGVILIVMLPVYLAGFLLSWRWEFMAGILFILWYACLLIPALQPIAYWLGPLKFMGIPILVQGIIYIVYSSKFKRHVLA